MHHKNIKLIIRKQLKKEFPNWKRLPKKMKREISNKVMAEVTANYDFNQEITAPVSELLGVLCFRRNWNFHLTELTS